MNSVGPAPAPRRKIFNKKTVRDHAPKDRRIWFWAFGLSSFGLAYYCMRVYLGWQAAWDKSSRMRFEQDADVASRYDKIADRYDSDLDLMERAMFLGWTRKKLCQKAKGHVLEVSAGTGRNTQFYKQHKGSKEGIESITFVDQSPRMLEICREQWKRVGSRFKGEVRFVVADAGAPNAIKPPSNAEAFDSIIQTFGLCSTPNPAQYLSRVGQLLRKPDGKEPEGGRIYLLEHGRGHYGWLNQILDGLAKEHADRFGCWWNRDIGAIVEASGLEIIEMKRRHFGTTWIFELGVAKNST